MPSSPPRKQRQSSLLEFLTPSPDRNYNKVKKEEAKKKTPRKDTSDKKKEPEFALNSTLVLKVGVVVCFL